MIYPRESVGSQCQLYVAATQINQDEELQNVIAHVANQIAQPASPLHPERTQVIVTTEIVQENTSAIDVWEQLLEKLNLFASLMDKVSEIHPYLAAAWTVLDAGRKMIVAQQERTSRVEELGQVIFSVYEIIDLTGDLKTSQPQQEILSALSKQTLECGYFIAEYYRDRSKWHDAFKNILSKTDRIIQKYELQFRKLKDALQQHTTIEIQFVVLVLIFSVILIKCIVEKGTTPHMPYYAMGARYQRGKQCLIGTREALLTNIRAWIDNSDGQHDNSKMLLLTGLSGTGKSSVANSIAEHYHKVNRLGSSFCFNRSELANRNSKHLFSTLAVDLAAFDPSFKYALVNCVGHDPSLCGTENLQEQLENFILKPVKDLVFVGPIVIVIDALDESGNLGSRYQLLQSLASLLPTLPSNFRILLTSRPEEDVIKIFQPNQYIYHKTMADVPHNSTKNDLLKYIQSELRDESSQSFSIFQDVHYRTLAIKAEGLFQWAYIACYAIKGYGGALPTPSGMLMEFTRLTSTISLHTGSVKGPLDQIYEHVLLTLVESPNDRQRVSKLKTFKALLGQVLAAFQPLSADCFKQMHTMSPHSTLIEDFDWALSKLGALLTGVIDYSEPIQFIHTSFQDFLTHESSGDFYIEDVSQHHDSFAWSAIHTLNKVLKFNMCSFPTSYCANSDVSGLHASAQFYFDTWSRYAIQYWGLHFAKSLLGASLESSVTQIVETKFLFWLEAISLLNIGNTAATTLAAINAFCKTEQLKLYILDAKKFVLMFTPVIVRSVPHIYLSSMACAPKKSFLYKQYAGVLQHLPKLPVGHVADWPMTIPVGAPLEGHTWRVKSVSYSPNGQHIVSGSYDKTIRIWDAYTGQPVGEPLVGHTHWVEAVTYSPDGQHILSGSADKTIRIWDAHTGQLVGIPLEGH
ncbi:hypothetical protein FA95DRAFT_1488222, partial [Auriscalpium vulgare]